MFGLVALGLVLYLLGGWLAPLFVYGGWLVAWLIQHWLVEPAIVLVAFFLGGWRLALVVLGGQVVAWWQYQNEQERLQRARRIH
jgi:hypothetical protein